jgi:mono/diheme cytochrome c family protein
MPHFGNMGRVVGLSGASGRQTDPADPRGAIRAVVFNIGGWGMKVISFSLAFQAAILATIFTAAGRAEDKGAMAFSKQDLQARLQYCQICHGQSGEGFHGAVPIPRLVVLMRIKRTVILAALPSQTSEVG